MPPLPSSHRLAALVQSAPFQLVILAVILFAGALAGLETSAALVERHGAVLRALNAGVIASQRFDYSRRHYRLSGDPAAYVTLAVRGRF
jgi:hypothetical protein